MGIDAHQHFWSFNAARDTWITDEMAVIQRNFHPADLKPLLTANGFDGCVAVQADQSEEENEFLIELAARNHFIKGIVGWVDLQADNVAERLAHYTQFPVVKGFRHVLQGEADRAFMLRPAFMRGIAALKQFDYTYDILVFPDQLKHVKTFVAEFPDQQFVIDHIAKPRIKDGIIEDWKLDIMEVAAYDNVSCKISGMVTEADWQGQSAEDFRPYIDVVADAFGPDRIMFGSDWPVCLVAASYNDTVNLVREYFSTFTQAEQEDFFGGNARRFYKLL
ncbi:amidohydrolase [Segetibacter sp. 3557_3]|nr:amidohydrolase [Segetibacter sp. 3557_3]